MRNRTVALFGAVMIVFSVDLLSAQAVYNGSSKHTFTTNYGTIDIGPFNSSWAHIYSNRPKFIFNKPVWIQGGTLSSYSSSNLLFQTNASTRMTILNSNGNIGIGTTAPDHKLVIQDTNANQLALTQSSGNSWQFRTGSTGSLIFRDDGLERMRIDSSGNLGLGTTSPQKELHITSDGRTAIRVGGPNSASGAVADLEMVPSNGGVIGASRYWIWSFRTDSWSGSPGDLALYSHDGTDYTSPIIVQSDGDVELVNGASAPRKGNVGIGTSSPDAKLAVKGDIHAEEVRVDLSVPAPDYVFEADYDLNSLEELQYYINTHGHLPNIPSAAELEVDGIVLGDMNMKLLEKIEELTLYILEQHKNQIRLEKRITELEKL